MKIFHYKFHIYGDICNEQPHTIVCMYCSHSVVFELSYIHTCVCYTRIIIVKLFLFCVKMCLYG